MDELEERVGGRAGGLDVAEALRGERERGEDFLELARVERMELLQAPEADVVGRRVDYGDLYNGDEGNI